MERSCVLGVTWALVLLMAAPAAATKPVHGDGTYQLDSTCLLGEGIPLRLEGTLAGCASVYTRENGSDTAVFDGAVVLDGRMYAGTVRIDFSMTDRFDPAG
jgi:hypothetical protein